MYFDQYDLPYRAKKGSISFDIIICLSKLILLKVTKNCGKLLVSKIIIPKKLGIYIST